MIKILLLSLSLFIASPFWPIGENPIVGDPFVIVNKSLNELAFIEDGKIQKIYPVATGKTEDLTPEGNFTFIVKAVNPYYIKLNIEGGASNNPLGSRWIGFDAEETGRIYGVHGTNAPWSIGRYVTAGCIRLLNKDVEELYDKIPIGTKILVVSTDKSFEELGKEHGALKN